MAARLLTLLLAALALLVQADLWLGKTSLPYVWSLQAQLAQQQAANDTARGRNLRITAEVNDLKEGLEMVEEKARGELGMVKADEILVQLTPPR